MFFVMTKPADSWSTSATWAVIGFSNIANSKKGWRCLQSSSINFDHPLCLMVSLDLPHVPSARYHKMIPPLDSNFCCYNHLARSLEGQIRWFSTTVAVAAIHPFWLMISSGLYYHSKSVYHSILHISWYIIIYWIVSWYPNILAMIWYYDNPLEWQSVLNTAHVVNFTFSHPITNPFGTGQVQFSALRLLSRTCVPRLRCKGTQNLWMF